MVKKLFFLSVITCFLSADKMHSQDMPEPDSPGNPPPPGLVVPIDKGTPWLAAAGIVLGVVLLKKRN